MGEPAEKLPADLMTVEELATRLGVCRQTAYASVREGEVPGVKRIGRLIRIHRPTVERWLASDLEKK